MTLSDRILLGCVRKRLAHFRTQADAADRFADCLVALLVAECARRNRLFDNWEGSRRREVEAAVEQARREAESKRFDSLGSDQTRVQ
jgi:hypothetical protein